MTNKRFNTQSTLTYNELMGIIDEITQKFKDEMISVNSDSIGPYKLVRGKAIAMDELIYKLEDHMANRHKDKTAEFGDTDNFN